MPLPSLSSFTRSELAKRPASAAVATSFHRSQADFVEGDTISIDLEQTWNQFIAAERSASLHIGQYLRFKGTEGGRHLVRGLGSNDSAVIEEVQANGENTSYWHMKAARDGLIKDCNDMLFWMDLAEQQERTPRDLSAATTMAGFSGLILVAFPGSWAGVAAGAAIASKVAGLSILSVTTSVWLSRWVSHILKAGRRASVQQCLEAAHTWTIGGTELRALQSVRSCITALLNRRE